MNVPLSIIILILLFMSGLLLPLLAVLLGGSVATLAILPFVLIAYWFCKWFYKWACFGY